MSENDNNFDALRRLLALKRHEIPPPGYFDDFSSSVMARIRAGEAVQKLPWVLRFLQIFEAKPAYPVALASSLCVLLLLGIVNVEQNPELAPIGLIGTTDTSASVADISAGGNSSFLAMVDTNSPIGVASSAGTASPAETASLFNVQPNPLFKQPSLSDGN